MSDNKGYPAGNALVVGESEGATVTAESKDDSI